MTGQISRDDDDDDGEKRGTDDCDDRWKPAACLPAIIQPAVTQSLTYRTGYDKHCVVCRRIAAWLAGIDMNPR